MVIRDGYKLSAIEPDIQSFYALTADNRHDEAVVFFRERLEKPTLFGRESSLIRAELLQRIDVEKLTNDSDKCFVLYSLALSLNITGGYPNRSIPLYERHDAIAGEIGDMRSLSQSLGHHAKALRQVGRFRESEAIARKGLYIIRQVGDLFREAVNLYWLGLGLVHRGESRSSEEALQRSLRIFRKKFARQSEGVVHTFLAQRALWLGDWTSALHEATAAQTISEKLVNDANHADLHGALKIHTAAMRMKGEATVLLDSLDEGEVALSEALALAREIDFVEEILPALRALALKSLKANELDAAREYLDLSWELAKRGEFKLYDADSHNILARIEIVAGNRKRAILAAETAFDLSVCDGIPFAYRRGLEDATTILNELGAPVKAVPRCDESKFPAMLEIELNPRDEYHTSTS